MADKEISSLPALETVTDDTMLPVYQPGAENPAQRMTGAQFRAFAEAAAYEHVKDMTQGPQGEQGPKGNGIKTIEYNDDGTITITLDDNTTMRTPKLRGEQGPQGNPGVYVLAEGETIEDVPEWADVVVNPDEEPPALELVATFTDGTMQTFTIYGEAVE